MNTFEKQAPMCTCDHCSERQSLIGGSKLSSEARTLGVGGSPLLVALGGEVALFWELVRSLRREEIMIA